MSSPLVDFGKSLLRKYENLDTKKQEADPGMVREANDSFRRKLTSDGPTLGAKKKTAKKTKKDQARKKD
jgi:hypothetical protein